MKRNLDGRHVLSTRWCQADRAHLRPLSPSKSQLCLSSTIINTTAPPAPAPHHHQVQPRPSNTPLSANTPGLRFLRAASISRHPSRAAAARVLLMLTQLPTTNHAHTHSDTSSRARNTTYPAVHHFASFSESRPTRQLRDFTRQNKADPCFQQQTKTRLPYPKHIASNASPSHPQCLPYVPPCSSASNETCMTRITVVVACVLTCFSGQSCYPPGSHRRERRECTCRHHAPDACQSRRTGD